MPYRPKGELTITITVSLSYRASVNWFLELLVGFSLLKKRFQEHVARAIFSKHNVNIYWRAFAIGSELAHVQLEGSKIMPCDLVQCLEPVCEA